jgi:hypothetical protein
MIPTMRKIIAAIATWFRTNFKRRTPEQIREDRHRAIEEVGPLSGVM